MPSLAHSIENSLQALWPLRYTSRQKWHFGILFVAYVIAGQIGAALFTSPAVISPVPGVALAGLFLGGLSLWPAIFLGTFVTIFINTTPSVASILLLPLAQTVQALVGAYLLMYLGFDPVLRRLRDMFSVMGVAFVVSTIVPTVVFIVRYFNELAGSPSTSLVTWGTWWTGYLLSLLVVAPLIMRWVAKPRFVRSTKDWFETIGVLAALAVVSWILFWTSNTNIAGVSLVYLLLVPLFWVAIRFGPRFTILSIFMVFAIGLTGMLYGPQALVLDQLGNRLFQLEIFFIILATIFYVITALQEERRSVIKQMTSYINQLEDALNKLSMQDQAKSDFVAVLAHELRNPLAPIVSSLELLRLSVPTHPQTDHALDLMDNRLKTIQRLLDDLLDVSRISQSKLRLKKELVELRPIIERSIQSVEHYLQTRDQRLTLDLDKEPIVLDADPVRIEQIVNNLLTNASKFTPQKGHISISAKREGSTAIIRVADSGIGIESSLLTRIFEPFTQLSKNGNEGLGIGLSLTQKLAEMHGGTVEARSEGADRGSEFEVRLPALTVSVSPITTEPAKKRPVLAPAAGRKILVVDDNEAAAQGIGNLLEHKGYTVDYAYTGMDAQRKIHTFGPSAVVLDIGLPDIDGYQVAQMMREQGGFMGTIVALTGYGQAEDKERAYNAGFNHHLTKPISIVDLEPLLGVS